MRDRYTRPIPSTSLRQSSHKVPAKASSSKQSREKYPPCSHPPAVDLRSREQPRQARPPIAPTGQIQEAPPAREPKERGPEVLEVTLALPTAYPPPPTLTVAPPPAPLPVFSDSDSEESDSEPKRTKGKKGGPSVPGHIQDANRMANTTVGPIPALLGARFIDGTWERDNSFRGMLPRNFLYDAPTNTVYPGALAYEFYVWDHDGRNGPHPGHSRGWTEWAPRGFPRTVAECKNLMFKVVTNSSAPALDRFEAWLILSEFMYLSKSFALSQRDHVMRWVITGLSMMRRPGPWITFDLVPLDPNAFAPPGSMNVRVPDPDPSCALLIDAWAQTILHHGRPGLRNEYRGIIFDRAFRVMCR